MIFNAKSLLMRAPLAILSLSLLIPSGLWARDAREEKRIEHLLQAVESLKGAAFIRNGTEYKAKDAGQHLRTKLKLAGARVKTAEDFIEVCASRSSFSGAAYKIRLSDGTITETSPFFRARLREFDEATKEVSPRGFPMSSSRRQVFDAEDGVFTPIAAGIGRR